MPPRRRAGGAARGGRGGPRGERRAANRQAAPRPAVSPIQRLTRSGARREREAREAELRDMALQAQALLEAQEAESHTPAGSPPGSIESGATTNESEEEASESTPEAAPGAAPEEAPEEPPHWPERPQAPRAEEAGEPAPNLDADAEQLQQNLGIDAEQLRQGLGVDAEQWQQDPDVEAEQPQENAPAEDAPAEDAPAEDAPAEDAPGADVPRLDEDDILNGHIARRTLAWHSRGHTVNSQEGVAASRWKDDKYFGTHKLRVNFREEVSTNVAMILMVGWDSLDHIVTRFANAMPTRDTWAELSERTKDRLTYICPQAETFYELGLRSILVRAYVWRLLVIHLFNDDKDKWTGEDWKAFGHLQKSLKGSLSRTGEDNSFDVMHRLNRHSLAHQIYVRNGIHVNELHLLRSMRAELDCIAPEDDTTLDNGDSLLFRDFMRLAVTAIEYDLIFVSSYHDIIVNFDGSNHAPTEMPELFGGEGPFKPDEDNPVKMTVRPGVSCYGRWTRDDAVGGRRVLRACSYLKYMPILTAARIEAYGRFDESHGTLIPEGSDEDPFEEWKVLDNRGDTETLMTELHQRLFDLSERDESVSWAIMMFYHRVYQFYVLGHEGFQERIMYPRFMEDFFTAHPEAVEDMGARYAREHPDEPVDEDAW